MSNLRPQRRESSHQTSLRETQSESSNLIHTTSGHAQHDPGSDGRPIRCPRLVPLRCLRSCRLRRYLALGARRRLAVGLWPPPATTLAPNGDRLSRTHPMHEASATAARRCHFVLSAVWPQGRRPHRLACSLRSEARRKSISQCRERGRDTVSRHHCLSCPDEFPELGPPYHPHTVEQNRFGE